MADKIKQGTSIFVTIFFWFLIFSSVAWASELTVSITANPENGSSPLSVFLSSMVSGGKTPYSYVWDFKDGETSNVISLSHIFTTAGSYTVSLIVTDSDNISATAEKTIIVSEAICDNNHLYLCDSSSCSSYGYWYDETCNSAPKPDECDSTHLSLCVTSSTCSPYGYWYNDTCNYSPEPLILSISANSTAGDAPLSVSFSSTVSGGVTPYSYTWDFKDGSTSSKSSPAHSFVIAGSYVVSLTVTDSDGATIKKETTITVNIAPLTLSISASSTSGDAPLMVFFSPIVNGGSTPYSYYAWDFKDGSTSSKSSPAHSFATAGSYAVSLTVTDNDGVKISAKLTITVKSSCRPSRLDLCTYEFDCTIAGGVWEEASSSCTGSNYILSEAPILTVTVNGLTVTVSWSIVKEADSYTLLYTPYTGVSVNDVDPATFDIIPMDGLTEYEVDLLEGDAFYVAIQAHNKAGNSDFSNIVAIVIEEGQSPGSDTDNVINEGSDIISGEVDADGVNEKVTIAVDINQKSYQVGDKLIVNLIFNGKDIVDYFVGLIFPDGNFQTFSYPQTPFYNEIVAYRTEVVLNKQSSSSVLGWKFSSQLSKGTYEACAAVAATGENSWQSDQWYDFKCQTFELK